MQSFVIAQNPQLVPVAARSLELAGDAVAAHSVSHSTVMVAAARALAYAAVVWVAIAVAVMVAAVARALALMGNHDNCTEQKTVCYFDLRAISVAAQHNAPIAVRIVSQFWWRDAHDHRLLPSDASPVCPATVAQTPSTSHHSPYAVCRFAVTQHEQPCCSFPCRCTPF